MEAVRQQRSGVAQVEEEPVESRRMRGGNTERGAVPDRGGPVDVRRVEWDGTRAGEQKTGTGECPVG
jgi:hypothetical protein